MDVGETIDGCRRGGSSRGGGMSWKIILARMLSMESTKEIIWDDRLAKMYPPEVGGIFR
jgi:hypothetical protein